MQLAAYHFALRHADPLARSNQSALGKAILHSAHRFKFPTSVVVVPALLMLSIALTTPSPAQSAQFQNSTLSGSGSSINVAQIPVLTSSGTFVYWNMIIEFNVASDGSLSVASGYPQFTPTPEPIINGFKAGTYLGPDDSTELITLNGPGVAPSGVTAWSLGPASNASGCLFPYDATWYDVGSKLSNNPLYSRIKAAGITSTLMQYGTGGGTPSCGTTLWETNSLLGFSQTNGALTITSFSKGGQDFNVPQDTKTYQLQP